MLINIQPPEPRELGAGAWLSVHSMFDTIQGEGPFTGRHALFIRLAGCNLQCPQCDTDYTSGRVQFEHGELAAYARKKSTAPLAVITGGEPFRQNIAPLCKSLVRYGFRVQIETNGRLMPQDHRTIERLIADGSLSIVVSPKTPTISSFFDMHAAAFKYVVRAGTLAATGLPLAALGMDTGNRILAAPLDTYDGDVWFQPEDSQDPEQNARNMAEAIRAVTEFDGCGAYTRRLGIQLHKLIGKE